jgi:hypothetical protein
MIASLTCEGRPHVRPGIPRIVQLLAPVKAQVEVEVEVIALRRGATTRSHPELGHAAVSTALTSQSTDVRNVGSVLMKNGDSTTESIRVPAGNQG